MGEAESKLNDATKKVQAHEEKLLTLLRKNFVSNYKVDPEKVKSMSLDQLSEAEKNLELLGVKPGTKPANFDVTGGNNGKDTRTDEQKLAERYPTMKVV